MALDPLATVSDLGARLGLDLTGDERAAAVLADASAAVRTYCGHTFTETTETITVQVRNGVATLPNGPVSEVDTVEVDGEEITFTWAGGRQVDVCASEVDVTYTWGYAEVPDVVIAVVCQVAGRAFGVNPQNAGSGPEQLGAYQVSVGVAGAAGPLGLLNDEKRALDAYRRKTRPAIRQSSWVPTGW